MLRRIFPLLLSALFLLSSPLLFTLPCAAQKTIKRRTAPTTKRTTTTNTTPKKKTTRSSSKRSSSRAATSVISTSQCVDLGLSVKWAGYNVGASHPEEAGNYYAWGELSPKSDYSESTYKYYRNGSYIDIGSSISGNSSYDVARAQWGYPWRMPTKAEMDEFLNRCTWTWTTYRGMNGYKVTGPSGNAIFLPATGYRFHTSLNYDGSDGWYWASMRNAEGPYHLIFRSGYKGSWFMASYEPHGLGASVRPVSD